MLIEFHLSRAHALVLKTTAASNSNNKNEKNEKAISK